MYTLLEVVFPKTNLCIVKFESQIIKKKQMASALRLRPVQFDFHSVKPLVRYSHSFVYIIRVQYCTRRLSQLAGAKY